MSRSLLPQSDADRVAAAVTGAAIVAVVWLVFAFAPDTHALSIASANAVVARHIDEGNRASDPADCATAAFAARCANPRA